jgi:hypothetical protein
VVATLLILFLGQVSKHWRSVTQSNPLGQNSEQIISIGKTWLSNSGSLPISIDTKIDSSFVHAGPIPDWFLAGAPSVPESSVTISASTATHCVDDSNATPADISYLARCATAKSHSSLLYYE